MYKKILVFFLFCYFSCQFKQENVIRKEITDWQFQHNGESLDATVPGNNFTDLLNHKLISDPFYGTYEDSVQWISDRDWNYRSRFSVSNKTLIKENQFLVFNGLDTYAKVYLNDSLILEANNMFRKWEIEVKGILREENVLHIAFASINKIEKEKREELGYDLSGGNRVHSRKAGFHYGWDWGAKISPTGIWRPIELIAYSKCKIKNVYIKQNEITDSLAKLSVQIAITVNIPGLYTISINKNQHQRNLKKGKQNITIPFFIENPKLWWPNGHGKQHLYAITTIIKRGGIQLDTKRINFGLRTINLITEKDSIGESFYFKINGKPIFMKGSNYIPQDNLQNRVSNSDYLSILTDVKYSNMNMLRVWGGGIYEEDIFYDLCDSLGILVWQDFMFACAMYPGDSSFLKNVKQEAIENIKRLNNHPSIALWCGNNENLEGWNKWGWQKNYSENQKKEIWNGYQKLFQKILPNLVAANSQTPYWESSPKFGRGNSKYQFEGDAHYWGVWHDAEPFKNFEKKVPRFMSEFGFQSFPQLSTISTFSDTADWNINSDVMKNHQKHPRGNELISEYMEREFNIPKSFKKFIYASQILQANGMRIGLEAHRRNQPYCMGTLYWQLNDCWPVASWSSRDYLGNWKNLHYTVQDVFSPIALSICTDEKGLIDIYAISDLSTIISDTLIIKIGNINGSILNQEKYVEIQPNSSHLLLENLNPLKKDQFIICYLKFNDIQSKVLFSTPTKNMNFPQPNIQTSWIRNTLTLSTDVPVFQLYLHGIEGRFSDNFFSLLPSEEKTIELEGGNNKQNNLLIWSLYNLNKN